MAHDPGRVLIFDTTLRDGEQSPGASLNLEEKLAIAQQLARLGVDVIEAGFPFASPGDFNAVQRIAQQVGGEQGPVICGLARASRGDIKACADAVAPAPRRRIHTFIATSDIHLEHKLRKSRQEVLAIVPEMVAYARSLVDDVEFSCEDAGRSDPEFLYAVIEAAINSGASTINIPDTVGYTTPAEFGALIAGIDQHVPNISEAVLSVHGHNDLGLAVANFLEAVKNGARQLECTINGIGERAGNAALEELVMALHVRRRYFNPFFGRAEDSPTPLTGVRTEEITKTSRLVSNLTGMVVQPNKAIVGANAFAHESGIHQDGVLKSRETYEIMRAQDVGWTTNKIVLGKHSGRNAFKTRMAELDVEFQSEEELNEVFANFKSLADKKHEIFDEDLLALVNESNTEQTNEVIKLVSLSVCSETGETPNARITLNVDGEEKQADATGSGPVDASFKAIENIVDSGVELQLYSVNAITSGTDAQGEVSVRVRQNGHVYNGHGADTDIVIASAKAYVNALNKTFASETRTHPQRGVV